jgi:hypothetical protein
MASDTSGAQELFMNNLVSQRNKDPLIMIE